MRPPFQTLHRASDLARTALALRPTSHFLLSCASYLTLRPPLSFLSDLSFSPHAYFVCCYSTHAGAPPHAYDVPPYPRPHPPRCHDSRAMLLELPASRLHWPSRANRHREATDRKEMMDLSYPPPATAASSLSAP